MTSRMTGPRRLPTWTVPDGVLESLTTWGPWTLAASSSAQSTVCCPFRGRPSCRLADLDDRVREVAGGDLDGDLVALLAPEERTAHRRLVGDAPVGRLRLGRSDDRERLRAVLAVDGDGGADLDVVGRVVLVD